MEIKKFKMKPVIVEAVRLTPENFHECMEFIGKNGMGVSFQPAGVKINTPVGIRIATDGHYLVRSEDGIVAPWREEEFLKHFEEVEDDSGS